MFQIQQNSTDFSPWLLYPANNKTIWAVVWGHLANKTLASQVVNFTLGVQHRSSIIVNAIPNDIVYDNYSKRVWILENNNLASYDPAVNNITITWSFPADSNPQYMTVDRNDHIWITLSGTDQIVDFQVGRQPLYYNITDSCIQSSLGCGPWGLALDPVDGSIWFAEAFAGRIGHLTPNSTPTSCTCTYYAPPPGLNLYGLVQVAASETGVIWFTIHEGNEFGSLNPSNGEWSLYPTGYCAGGCAFSLPNAISIGSQGQVWFSEHIAGRIGRFYPDNRSLVEYNIPTTSNNSNSCGNTCTPFSWWMWPGFDNLVWFVAFGLGEIGYVNASAPVSIAPILSATSIALPPGSSASVTVSTTYGGAAPSINALGTSLDASSNPPMLSFSAGRQVLTVEGAETSTLTVSAAWTATLGSRYIAVSVYDTNVTVNTLIRVNVVAALGAYTTIGFAGLISVFATVTVSFNWFSKKRKLETGGNTA